MEEGRGAISRERGARNRPPRLYVPASNKHDTKISGISLSDVPLLLRPPEVQKSRATAVLFNNKQNSNNKIALTVPGKRSRALSPLAPQKRYRTAIEPSPFQQTAITDKISQDGKSELTGSEVADEHDAASSISADLDHTDLDDTPEVTTPSTGNTCTATSSASQSSDKSVASHLRSVLWRFPTAIEDMIFNFAYPRVENFRYLTTSGWLNREKERKRQDRAYTPLPFPGPRAGDFLVSKRYFVWAFEVYIGNQVSMRP